MPSKNQSSDAPSIGKLVRNGALAVIAGALLISCSVADRIADGDAEGAADEIGNRVLTGAVAAVEQGEFESENFTPENRYYTGRGVSAAILGQFPAQPVSGSGREALQHRYVNLIGQTLLAAGNAPAQYRGYTLGIIETPDPSAFSTPGGFIWVGTGLFDLVSDEDELAAAIAHEAGHAVHSHAMREYDDQSGGRIFASGYAAAAEGDPLLENSANLFGGLADIVLNASYAEEYEFEADRTAVDLLQRSGYSPQAMLRLLEKVKRFMASADDPGRYLEGHPPIDQRIQRVRDYLRAQGYVGITPASRKQRFEKAFR